MVLNWRLNGILAAAGLAAACALAGCGREADRAARPEAQAADAAGGGYARASYTPRRAQAQDTAPAPAYGDGKPTWASSRRYSAEESEQRQFERNGAAFSARSADDYVAKAHAFLDTPPASAQSVVRANGDKLYYDPRSNVFAVVDKQGAPRTMFKPREGMAYWTQQKQSLADSGGRRRARDRQSSGDDSNG